MLNASLWKEKAYACAVTRSSIKISPEIKEEWKDQCVFADELFFQKLDGNLCFKFTDSFINFYEMPNSELDVSGYNDEILVTVESTIIPVDAPYDYWIPSEKTVIRGRVLAALDFELEIDYNLRGETPESNNILWSELKKRVTLGTNYTEVPSVE